MSAVPASFRALVVDERDGKTVAELQTRDRGTLAQEGVIVKVRRAALNYKDGLAITGRGKILRKLPMVAGVELAGTVVESKSPEWPVGANVMAMGWGIGERFSGAYGEYFAARPEWLEQLPAGYDHGDAMAIGIAGITAMECIDRLRSAGLKKDAPVLVTGAAGGVGSMAVALLASLGYEVAASTGRIELEPYLRAIGAKTIIGREQLASQTKPLASERWAGAIDTVGGTTLSGLLAEMHYGASVAAVGLAAGAEFETTVFPFILRAVSLLGIDSVALPLVHRAKLWSEISSILPRESLAKISEHVPFEKLVERAHAIVDGKVRGRTVIDIG